MAGRNVWQMAATTPGVLKGQTTDIGLSFRGAGQREIQNSLTLDGINATSNLLAMTSTRPMADAVTEVTVQTGSTSAEYGAYLGVAVNVVTKSGTNGFHGALFEYFQGDKLESRGYFDNRNLPESPKKSNQFGVQFDGPVMIPGLYDGKNKTFFMGAYEGLRSNRQTSPFASVPTAKMRAGDFSEISTQIRNPYTKVPYPGNIIPQSDIAAQALELLQYYPQPNLPGLANNYQTDVLTTNENDQLLLRVDQNIGQTARVYARYNWVDAFDGFGAAVPSTGFYQPRKNKNTLLSYQQTLSPTLLNDFRIGWHRLDLDTVNNFDIDGNGTASSDLGIPGFDADVRYDNFGIPTVSVTGFTGLGAGGTNWYQFDTTFQVSNVLSWTKGTHNLRAGIDLRKLRTGRLAANSPRGAFGFTSVMTGHAVADFMTGVPATVGTPVDQLQGDVGQWRNGFFVNDVWQATQRMTLSLGLRYERNTPVQTYEGVASMLNADQTQIIPTTFPSPGFEFTEPNNKDWAPRLGATYRLTDKTVLRAGWGIYYNPNQMNSYTFLTNNPPVSPEFTFTNDVNNPTLNFDRPLGTPGGPTGAPNMITPNRHMPNGEEEPVERGPAARDLPEHGRRARVPVVAHREPRSQLLQQPAAAGARRHRSASSESAVPPDPHDSERPHRRLRSGHAHRAPPHDQRLHAQRALHVVEDARHGHALQRRRPDDGQLRHLARLRPGQLGRAAPPGGQLPVGHAVLPGVRQPPAARRARRLADRRHHHAPERHAAQRPGADRHRQRRLHQPAPEPGQRQRRTELPGQPERPDADQLHRPGRVRAAGGVHVRRHAPQLPARAEVQPDRRLVHEELRDRRPLAHPAARRGVQPVQPGQLGRARARP